MISDIYEWQTKQSALMYAEVGSYLLKSKKGYSKNSLLPIFTETNGRPKIWCSVAYYFIFLEITMLIGTGDRLIDK